MFKFQLLLLLAGIGIAQQMAAQNKITLTGFTRDAASGEALVGATIQAPNLKIGGVSDENGAFILEVPGKDSLRLLISYVGYTSVDLKIMPATAVLPLEIRLKSDEELEEVTISTTRTNSRIEDLAVKVEVLGAEELEEEASLVPGGMGSLLGDLSVITIQRTGAVSGNDAVRMQGLAPGYTQLLQDGLPLYGGFSGSLGVLNIPPLDLRQVEIVKGSSSTLYGGGAIGGLINFLSKTPGEKPVTTFLLNQTTLGETDANAFFSRKTTNSQGFTILTAGTLKAARDINSDGFAEVARSRQWLVHPRYFWGLGKKTSGDLGFTFSQNHLRGGDWAAIKSGEASAEHPFLQKEQTQRLSANGQIATRLSKNAVWTFRGAGSVFQRSGNYAALHFKGRQINTYLESNVVLKTRACDWVFGANLTSEHFQLREAFPALAFGNFGAQTLGVFVQNDYRFASKWTLQTGFRVDHNSRYGSFALPRASLLYKVSRDFSARLGYGRGYKTPDLFLVVEPSSFPQLQPLSRAVRADVAHSLNADLNYQKLLFDAVSMQINQAFYVVALAHPFEVVSDGTGNISLQNAAATGRVYGTDTYIQFKYSELELYFGYNHTLSERHLASGRRVYEPFNPQNKIAATLAWSVPEKWRFGVETAYTGNQYVGDNRQVPSYWFWAAMIARQFHWGILALNCENIGDARQSRKESLVTGGFLNPSFTPIWGPVEGRVVNLSLKINL